MISDDFGYPAFHGDTHAYDYHSRYPHFSTATMSHEHRRHSDRYNLRGSFPLTQNHHLAMSVAALPPHEDDGRAYLPESMAIAARGPPADDSEFQSAGLKEPHCGTIPASPIPSSRFHKRERKEANDDPSFIPPPPGDTGETYGLLSTFSSSGDLHGDGETATKRQRHTLNDYDPNVVAAYQDVGVLPHPGSYHHSTSYDQDYADHHHWAEHNMTTHVTVAGQYAYAPPPHGFHIGAEPFSLSHPDAHYPRHSNGQLHSQRSASSDDETVDDEDEDMKPTAVRVAAAPAVPVSSATRTTGGECTSELKLYPSDRELDFLPNPRAKEALKVWYRRIRELVEFKNKHGHSNVRQKYTPNPQLGIWVNKQRCTRASLTREKFAALESVGFDWGKKKGEHAWKTQFNELVEYKRVHRDCKYPPSLHMRGVPTSLTQLIASYTGLVPTKCSANPSLGRWVSTQRAQYKHMRANRKTTMTEEKASQLQRIGFVWSMVEVD